MAEKSSGVDGRFILFLILMGCFFIYKSPLLGHLTIIFFIFIYTLLAGLLLHLILIDHSRSSIFMITHYHYKSFSDRFSEDSSVYIKSKANKKNVAEIDALKRDELVLPRTLGRANKTPVNFGYDSLSYPHNSNAIIFFLLSFLMAFVLATSTNVLGSWRLYNPITAEKKKIVIPMMDRNNRYAANPAIIDHLLTGGRAVYITGSNTDIRYFGESPQGPIPARIPALERQNFIDLFRYTPVHSNIDSAHLSRYATRHLREWHKVDGGNFKIKVSHLPDARDYIRMPGSRHDGLLIEYQLTTTGLGASLFRPSLLSNAISKYVYAPVIAANNVLESTFQYQNFRGESQITRSESRQRMRDLFGSDKNQSNFNPEDLFGVNPMRYGLAETAKGLPDFFMNLIGGEWLAEYRLLLSAIDKEIVTWGDEVAISKSLLECEVRNFIRAEHGPTSYSC